MNDRLRELISSFSKHHIDAFLVTKDINISYLAGFPASESWLLVLPKKTFYVTDFRYILEAQKGLKGITVKRYTKSFSETIFSIASTHHVKRIGFDDRHVPLSTFKRLKKSLRKKIKLVAINGLIENLREIKTKHEIAQIKKALKLNLEAYAFLKGVIKPGRSEKEVLRKLEQFVRNKNAAFSFPPIIASGPNSCFPHAKVTDRKIKNNEAVLVDMGMDTGGYKSDLTRIFFLGKIPRQIREVCAIVYTAQKKAISKIKANVRACEIDYEARNYIAKNGLGKFFGHSLGHGVGLEIHEGPTVSQRSPAILKEGMVFTVEPAVYIPNKFGIRIEDMVLVTHDGCEILSSHRDIDQTCP